MRTPTNCKLKLKGFLSAFIAFLAVLTACTNEESLKKAPDLNKSKSDYSILLSSLEEYYNEFSSTHVIETRGDAGWSKFKEAVKADHVGFSGGSTVLSIGESRKKWKELQQKEKEQQAQAYSISNFESIIIQNQIDSLKNLYILDTENIGALHNASILQSFLDNDMEFESTEELVSSILLSFKKLGLDTSIYDAKTAVNEIDNFSNNIEDEDISLVYQRLSLEFPEKIDIFNILNHYLICTEQLFSVENIDNFTSGYFQIIENSNIDNDSKSLLRKNLSITPASHILWREIDSFCK